MSAKTPAGGWPKGRQHTGAYLEALIELLKLTRANWVSKRTVSAEVGFCPQAAKRWLDGLEEHGLLVSDKPKTGRSGPVPKLYTLSRTWGGQLDKAEPE